MIRRKTHAIIAQSVDLLNSLLGYSQHIPDAPVTRIHRLNDKPAPKSSPSQKAEYPNYKNAVLDFILRNPRCGAKEISAGLSIPHASVQTILTKAAISKDVLRQALHEKRGCRPIYVYWIDDERPK
jgi:hypothetical protein